jgi:sugar phosphate permease
VFLLFAVASAAIAFRVTRLSEPRRTDHATGEGERGIGALWRAVRYALRVPTYRMIVLAGAVGDFFFAAIAVFGVLFAVHQYDVSQSTAAMLLPVVGIGAFIGLVVSGRVTDALMASRIDTARVLVPAMSLVASAVVLASAAVLPSVAFGLPILFVGGLLLAAATPPLDAARLDVVRAAVWGRAEGVRTTLRVAAQAVGPLAFGFLSDRLAGGDTDGMRIAFLVLLVPLALSGVILFRAAKTYGSDLAAARPLDAAAEGNGDAPHSSRASPSGM